MLTGRSEVAGRRMVSLTRTVLLRARVHEVPEGYAADPHSAAYLYIVQQRKRLALAACIGRLRPRNIALFPVIAGIIALRAGDLWIANLVIRALINERDLLAQDRRPRRPAE